MEKQYAIKMTERQVFLLVEGLDKLTQALAEVPRNLSEDLRLAAGNLVDEVDELRQHVLNSYIIIKNKGE